MSLLATATATAIAAASAAATVATFFAYLYFARRSDAHAAREEALALAETRREVIVDLRQRVATLEQRLRETTVDRERRLRALERSLQRTEAEAREHAYRMQRFYATSLSDLLRDVQVDLEKKPPNLEGALTRIRDLLDGERPAA
jgi:DNA anti-recombination protein RmuC